MQTRPLYVLFLWHMHQPYYKDDWSGRYLLPWTRLHGIKDYYDLPAYQLDYPAIRQTFNLVPSLILQLEDYAAGTAIDTFLELTRVPASDLDESARRFLLKHFFSIHYDRLLMPQPRYRDLAERRREPALFLEEDFRDLQVWFNLAWSGPALRENPVVAGLIAKQRGFSEGDKEQLLAVQQEFVGRIVPLYREMAQRGEIELSATPFYHPILPLLCSSQAGRVARPDLTLPETIFAYPEDAGEQVRRSLDFFVDRFGAAPAGMWPAEGSVSPEAARTFAENGVQWIASDEDVLHVSLASTGQAHPKQPLAPSQLHRPYRYRSGNRDIAIFFRDHQLSDLIGFSYARQPAATAANDLVDRLLSIRQGLDDEPYVVSIILDGENAWEHYEDNARPFFRYLYERLSQTPELETITPSTYLARHADTAPQLENLHSGSWINASFKIWMGHPDKNRAWTLLARARRGFEESRAALSPEAGAAARESLLRAEGSDWFWWYGDDHSSDHKAEFDLLFRNHLKAAYHSLGLPQPAELDIPIGGKATPSRVRAPSRILSPEIDGKESDFFEWLGAGQAHHATATGAMHQVEPTLERLLYGFDHERLFLRADLARSGVRLRFCFGVPVAQVLVVELDLGSCRTAWEGEFNGSSISAACSRILELSISRADLGEPVDGPVHFYLEMFEETRSLERWPDSGCYALPLILDQ
ncbi:MAG: glycoside hydrolase [Acidobacteriota bacterium]